MSSYCRLGESSRLKANKRRNARWKMRALINEHVSDPEGNKELQDMLNKLISLYN